MFIGEMGCWLVVLGFYLHRNYLSRTESAPLLYQPISNTDDDNDSTFGSVPSPIVKPVFPNDESRRQLAGWRLVLLALPACCDITGTTLMNVGLLFVAASIYQMTRGALVLFVGLFSVLFLKRKLYLYQWLALVIAVLGVAIVGLAGALFSGDKTSVPNEDVDLGRIVVRAVSTAEVPPSVLWTIIGVLMIAFAQIFTASQFVSEEWILERYALQPLKVVAWEGTFGLLVTLVGQVILHFAVGQTPKGRYGYFDAREGYDQIFHNRTIAVTSILIMISIGGFNFFGLSVTRTVSATSRSTIDTCRTLFIWLVSLGLGWESFKWLQVVGFALLVYGTFLFNDLVRPPLKACLPSPAIRERRDSLLPEEPIEHQ